MIHHFAKGEVVAADPLNYNTLSWNFTPRFPLSFNFDFKRWQSFHHLASTLNMWGEGVKKLWNNNSGSSVMCSNLNVSSIVGWGDVLYKAVMCLTAREYW